MLQKGFCFFVTLLFASSVWAQGVDDIPFLFDDDDHFPVQEPVKTPAPVVSSVPEKKPVLSPKPEQPISKPIKFNPPTSNQPNIGLNAEPLDTLDILPPPAPRVTIDLTSPKPQPVQPIAPVNTRTEGIDILSNPVWDETTSGDIPVAGEIGALQNVRGFDLEGFYLGMNFEEVLDLVRENGYKIVSTKDTISKFRTSYYEDLCKNKGIRAPEKIRSCISKMSKLNGTTYVSLLKVARPRTHESIEFSFSSPATDNRVWKIHYENKGDNSLNFTRANTRRKLDRQEAFLNALFDKFGTPDDPKKYIWGSEDDAFMRAGMYGSNYDAFITLTDVELEDDDLLEAKDWLDETKPFEHFGFED